MAVHSSGDGGSWLEDLGIDEPHGLDYREFNDLRIGTRLRLAKEHVSFAAASVGGEHMPGKCGVMLTCDNTADFTVFVDNTTAPKGAMAYCISYAQMWCMTADATGAAPDWTIVKLGPLSFCLGEDYSWGGDHDFDGTVNFNSAVEFSADVTVTLGGDLTCGGCVDFDGTVNFNSAVEFSSDVTVYIDGDLSLGGVASFGGDVSIDGTLAMQDAVLTGDSTFTFDPIAGETGPTFKILGDWSARAMDVTYTARTDGQVTAYASKAATILNIGVQSPAGTHRVRSTSPSGKGVGVTCLVKGGDTWAVVGDDTDYGASTVYWLPFGDNT